MTNLHLPVLIVATLLLFGVIGFGLWLMPESAPAVILEPTDEATLPEVVEEEDNQPPAQSGEESPIIVEEPPTDEPMFCTMDAKLCPDGSYVGRVAPGCQFAACPAEPSGNTVVCTDEMKQADFCTMEYAPVCGLVEVQCITTPCNPVPETFSNGCVACSQGNVLSYTAGECTVNNL